MHRVIARRAGIDLSSQIDHVNGDKLDDRRANLRAASQAENMQNCPKHKDGVSGFKGVSRTGRRYVAQIFVNGYNMSLGVYETPEQASVAYDYAAIKYFGEFAKLNGVDVPFTDTRGMWSSNKSGFRGVSWHDGKWSVFIRVNGVTHYLGRFTDKIQAALKYNQAAAKCFGPRAYLNPIPSNYDYAS